MMNKLASLPSSPRSALGFFCMVIYCLQFVTNFVNVQGFDRLLQLPEFGDLRKIFGSTIVVDVRDYGAKGDGSQDDTKVFTVVWEMACSSKLPARIVIPDGICLLVRPISLAGPCLSNVTLTISGTIVAPSDPDVWDGLDSHKWIYFHGVKHLTLEGGGMVNGMGREWWARSCKTNATNPCKHAPTAITFHRCKDLKIRDLKMVDSQQMHMAFTTCVGVSVSHLRVLAPADSPNTDGIHISESTMVEVKDTIIGTGDDCISIVSNSSQIQVKNIICGPGHGISIGSLGKSGSCDQVQDVLVSGAVLSDTDNGVRIKTWQGGSGFVSNIAFEDLWMENVSNPIIIDQYYCDSKKPCSNKTSAVRIDHIAYVNIKGTSATEEAIRFACSDASPCEGLYLENVQLVSSTGGATTSFCWESKGSSRDPVYPPPCFSTNESSIEQIISSSSHLQTI